MPGSPTRTRPSTAGRTTSITTSASTPRARTLLLAVSSSSPTDPYARADGTSDGMTSEVRTSTTRLHTHIIHLSTGSYYMEDYRTDKDHYRIWKLPRQARRLRCISKPRNEYDSKWGKQDQPHDVALRSWVRSTIRRVANHVHSLLIYVFHVLPSSGPFT